MKIPYLSGIQRSLSLVSLYSVLTVSTSAIVDLNLNGLSDIWEQLYGQHSLVPENDDDGDGYTNLQESRAGTDPLDPADSPSIVVQRLPAGDDSFEITFNTKLGRSYNLEQTEDLTQFAPSPLSWLGTGAQRTLNVIENQQSTTQGPVIAQFWPNIAYSDFSIFDTIGAPSGIVHLPNFETKRLNTTGFVASYAARIKVPSTDNYTFYLSSSGPAQLCYYGESGWEVLIELPEGQSSILPGEFERFPSQAMINPLALNQDDEVLMCVRYFATTPLQHAQVGWSTETNQKITQIGQEDLSEEFYEFEVIDSEDLLFHDYDTSGQDTLLWPQNTALVPGPEGMSGNAEYITGDPGANPLEKVIAFASQSTDHLYASWLFHLETGHEAIYLQFINDLDPDQEGPNILMEDGLDSAAVRLRTAGSEFDQFLAFDETYRIEIIATRDPSGLPYATPLSILSVAENTFDIYISNMRGELLGSGTGISFRDDPAQVLGFDSMQLTAAADTASLAYFDAFEITSGRVTGTGYLVPHQAPTIANSFYRLNIAQNDQDGDGIRDWEELALAKHFPSLFFDAETTDATPDLTAITNLLNNSQGTPEISIVATDADAFESNYPNVAVDTATITFTRTGALTPVSINITVDPDLIPAADPGIAGDEPAESSDYSFIDEDGEVITDTLEFEFGETEKTLTVTATDDGINEYPETLNIVLVDSGDGSYTVSPTEMSASVVLYDLPDTNDNLTLFTGTFSQDVAADTATTASGTLSATLNGNRTEMRIWTTFSGLASAQNNAHVHKENVTPTAGAVVYPITVIEGDPASGPLNGELDDYGWDLTQSSGAIPTAGGTASKQVLIDSLFGQNGETRLYLNVHTENNPSGEISAFFGVSGGSISDPGDAAPAATPGSAEYPQLTGDLLEADIRRFLNQASFGAIDSEVQAMLQSIETERLSDPNYHRNTAFSAWIDEQIDSVLTPQTYILDLTLSSQFQTMTVGGLFDATTNPDSVESPELIRPSRPASWPSVDRSDPNAEFWYLDIPYPFQSEDFDLAEANEILDDLINDGGTDDFLFAAWQTMMNGEDQLRQKMGFALQQIVVVSLTGSTLKRLGAQGANYQDMLNTYAFSYYRDILGYVNWSPMMGAMLSSINNQKAVDFDGDGFYDSFPDENLARENMQLFSIGLFDLWSDGTLKLTDEGLPNPTYNNDDIKELARIITGQSFGSVTEEGSSWGGAPYVANNDTFSATNARNRIYNIEYFYPMKMFGDFHSTGIKEFTGAVIDNTDITDPTQQGIQDYEDALNWLAGNPGDGQPDFDMVNSHVSTPAFISRLLIQRFTTSNPSRDYLHRVATAFKNSEGSLADTIRAILLDPEARNIDLADNIFGMKKSPIEAFLQMARALSGYSYLPLYEPVDEYPFNLITADYSDPDLYLSTFGYPSSQANIQRTNLRYHTKSLDTTEGNSGLQMDPMYQDSVFNFYLPNYAPTGPLAQGGWVAPEMQIATEPELIRNINFFGAFSSVGTIGNPLGATPEAQDALFGADSTGYENLRIDLNNIIDTYYPSTAPTPTAERSSESLADEEFLDALDKLLTNGIFKMRYPYDDTDDDDPNIEGVDDLLKNPREIIIDLMTTSPDPFDGINDESNKLSRASEALYLLSISPEYQIRR